MSGEGSCSGRVAPCAPRCKHTLSAANRSRMANSWLIHHTGPRAPGAPADHERSPLRAAEVHCLRRGRRSQVAGRRSQVAGHWIVDRIDRPGPESEDGDGQSSTHGRGGRAVGVVSAGLQQPSGSTGPRPRGRARTVARPAGGGPAVRGGRRPPLGGGEGAHRVHPGPPDVRSRPACLAQQADQGEGRQLAGRVPGPHRTPADTGWWQATTAPHSNARWIRRSLSRRLSRCWVPASWSVARRRCCGVRCRPREACR